MASAQKKSNSRSGSSSQSGGRKSSGGRSGQGKRAQNPDKKVQSAPAKHPVHREIGGVVCLLLAFFGAIGYFGMQAAFIDLFRGLLQGLFGYGYYLVPPILLLMAYILFFHRQVNSYHLEILFQLKGRLFSAQQVSQSGGIQP